MCPKRNLSKTSKDSHKIIKNTPRAPQPSLVQPPPSRLHQEQPQPPPPQLRQQEPSRPPRPHPIIRHILPQEIIHTNLNNFKTIVQRLTGLESTSTSTTLPSSSSSTPTSPFLPSLGSFSPATRFATTKNVNFSNELGFAGGVETMDRCHHQNQAMERPSGYHAESLSPATRFAVTENANFSNELGFAGGVDTMDRYHHQNQAIEQPGGYNAGSLSQTAWFPATENAGSTSLPSISPDFFSPVGQTDTQGSSSFFLLWAFLIKLESQKQGE